MYFFYFQNYSFDEYDSKCVPLPTNYDGSTFLTRLNIGLVNGKGIDKNYFSLEKMKKDFAKDDIQ